MYCADFMYIYKVVHEMMILARIRIVLHLLRGFVKVVLSNFIQVVLIHIAESK